MYLYSYSETEQYEEAVRDYEKICKMDKTRGVYTSITVLLWMRETTECGSVAEWLEAGLAINRSRV